MKIKSIKIHIETEDGLSSSSMYVAPEFRTKRPKFSPFKEMEKNPYKWTSKMIKDWESL